MITAEQAPPIRHSVTSNVPPGSVDDAHRLARLYDSLGLSMIPIRAGTKIASKEWKQYQTERATIDEVSRWIDAGKGLAVVLGQVSNGWVCRDFDDNRAYELWAADYPQLAESLPRSRTKRGFHVFVRVAERTKTKPFAAEGELRGEGSYVLVPPTPYPTRGGVYEWVIPLIQMEPAMCLSDTGLAQPWLDDNQCTQTTHDIGSSESSVLSESSVCKTIRALTPEQRDAIEDAIEATVPAGVGGRNDGIFRFARRVVAILEGKPDSSLAERLAVMWFMVAQPSIGTQDVGVTIADFQHMIGRVNKPDHGKKAADKAWELAQGLAPPWFVKTLAAVSDDSAVVWLAKLVVALDFNAGGGPWLLPCRDPARLIGRSYSFRNANRQLGRWVKQGILELVEKGQSGTKSRLANKYRLIPPQSPNATQPSAREDDDNNPHL